MLKADELLLTVQHRLGIIFYTPKANSQQSCQQEQLQQELSYLKGRLRLMRLHFL